MTHISWPDRDDWGHLHWGRGLAEQPGQIQQMSHFTDAFTLYGCIDNLDKELRGEFMSNLIIVIK